MYSKEALLMLALIVFTFTAQNLVKKSQQMKFY